MNVQKPSVGTPVKKQRSGLIEEPKFSGLIQAAIGQFHLFIALEQYSEDPRLRVASSCRRESYRALAGVPAA